jgi:hypothetical protein
MTKIPTKIIPYHDKDGHLTGFKVANEEIYLGLAHGTFYKGVDFYFNECRDIVISAGDVRVEVLGGWEHTSGLLRDLIGDLDFNTHWNTEESVVARRKKEAAGDLNYIALNKFIEEEERKERAENVDMSNVR